MAVIVSCYRDLICLRELAPQAVVLAGPKVHFAYSDGADVSLDFLRSAGRWHDEEMHEQYDRVLLSPLGDEQLRLALEQEGRARGHLDGAGFVLRCHQSHKTAALRRGPSGPLVAGLLYDQWQTHPKPWRQQRDLLGALRLEAVTVEQTLVSLLPPQPRHRLSPLAAGQ